MCFIQFYFCGANLVDISLAKGMFAFFSFAFVFKQTQCQKAQVRSFSLFVHISFIRKSFSRGFILINLNLRIIFNT